MSEFKYACPVCGQHMICDSSQAGAQVDCPTCFQKITVPQAPAGGDQKFILTGTKKSERPITKILERSQPLPATKRFPGVIVVLAILLCIVAVAAFVYRGTIFKPTNRPSAPTTASSETGRADLPPLTGKNYWTLNVNAVGTPEVPAGGKVHGKSFTGEKMILNADGLTIRTASFPPEAGVTIYLRPNPIESLFGKTISLEADTPGAPAVFLRWKDAQGQAAQQPMTGYALRIEFGQPVGGHVSGKIYLCTPDDLKSFVVGRFNAEIVRRKPPQ